MSRKNKAMMGPAEVAGIAGSGVAALAVFWMLTRALRSKGVFSDIEIFAILHEAIGRFSQPRSELDRLLFQSAQLTIGQMLADLQQAPPTPETKH